MRPNADIRTHIDRCAASLYEERQKLEFALSVAALTPRLVREVGRILRNGVECPFERAAARVESADLTARGSGVAVVRHTRADDDEIADDGGRRRFLVRLKLKRGNAQPNSQVDDPARPEAWARLPGRGVERKQARIDRGSEDAARAGAPWRSAGVAPEGYATAHEVAVATMRIHAGIEAPAFCACGGIERGDDARWRTHIHRAVHDDWRHLEGGRPVAHARQVGHAGVIHPCDLQLCDVGARDLRQR